MPKKRKKYTVHQQIIKPLLIGVSVIAFWRGAWGLMDVYLFPENFLLSHLTSLFIGFFILFLTHYVTKELL